MLGTYKLGEQRKYQNTLINLKVTVDYGQWGVIQ